MRPNLGTVTAGRHRLYCRDVGEGQPILVLHGGPSFDHSYLLPELDRLAESFHLVYYDQRGRGRSAADLEARDVSLRSEVEDVERVRMHFGLESVAVLGHSWGGTLAMQYAASHPDRVSHLILLDTGPASAADWPIVLEEFARRRPAGDQEAMQTIAASAAYERGDLATEVEFYRNHFRMTVARPDDLESIVQRLRANATEQGVLLGRAIGARLYEETFESPDWDLFPALRALVVPTLVLRGADDFIPIEVAARIADAMPRARLKVLPGCGHFTFVEAPDVVRAEVVAWVGSTPRGP